MSILLIVKIMISIKIDIVKDMITATNAERHRIHYVVSRCGDAEKDGLRNRKPPCLVSLFSSGEAERQTMPAAFSWR